MWDKKWELARITEHVQEQYEYEYLYEYHISPSAQARAVPTHQ